MKERNGFERVMWQIRKAFLPIFSFKKDKKEIYIYIYNNAAQPSKPSPNPNSKQFITCVCVCKFGHCTAANPFYKTKVDLLFSFLLNNHFLFLFFMFT